MDVVCRAHVLILCGTDGCGGCAQGTYCLTGVQNTLIVVSSNASNPLGINCANICCKADGGDYACCNCKFLQQQQQQPLHLQLYTVQHEM